ncbi:MAG TPA: MHYT domain-containing protein, partial [Gemmatimonadales bacterium]|nr:MHYT domain-containing protein [Gemmatimonadales bacterium]
MFDPWLSGFTFGIAILAAYVALALANRIAATESRETRVPWFILGSLATGLGLWAMHFVGLMAFQILQVISYDVNHLIGSAIAATFVAAVILVLGSRRHLGPVLLAAGSIAVAAGLTATHLVAIGGLHAELTVSYRAVPLALGVGVAVLAGLLLLAAPERLRGGGSEISALRVTISVGAGVGLAGAHFLFLLATTVARTGRSSQGDHMLLTSPALGAVLVVAAVLILSVALLGALADRYLLARSS